jgi:hypothetical protein
MPSEKVEGGQHSQRYEQQVNTRNRSTSKSIKWRIDHPHGFPSSSQVTHTPWIHNEKNSNKRASDTTMGFSSWWKSFVGGFVGFRATKLSAAAHTPTRTESAQNFSHKSTRHTHACAHAACSRGDHFCCQSSILHSFVRSAFKGPAKGRNPGTKKRKKEKENK